MDKYIGRLLDNRYEILEVIGTGGMAVVYKARCHRLNRLVAIKILKDDYLQDEEFRRRFHAESQAVAMLSHPNIVAVYDVSSSDEADYIVMELIDGISLKQYMQKKGVLNWKETLHFAIQIAKALEHAHSRGIVHRDIKPHNVMVLKNGSVKVADFGIARLMSKGNTLTKEALGSVHYISPEQAKGGRVDNRSDIYSLGVVMYEMMSGRPPYDGESPVAVAIQHINGGAIMPSILNPNIPGGLEQIIMKAMAHAIDDRYSSAADMLHDMDEFRKDPTTLFDYNAPPLDEVTKLQRKPEEENSLAARTTAERMARRNGTQNKKAAPQRKTGSSGEKPAVRKKESVEERNGRTATIAIIACSLAMVVAIVIFLVILFSGDAFADKEPLCKVPYLVGMEFDELTAPSGFKLKDNGEEYDDTVKKGLILKQSPEAGEEVVKGTTIFVTVSKGPRPKASLMPDVVDQKIENAKNNFTNSNLQLEIREEYHDSVAKDHVTRTDPVAGTELAANQKIIIYVSKGPDPNKAPENKTAQMPDVTNETLESAIKTLENQEMELKISEEKVYDSAVPVGTVIGTKPKAGENIETGDRIVLYISKGPEIKTAQMPDVTNGTQDAAEKTLNNQDMALDIVPEEVFDFTVPAGMVIKTEPEAGQDIITGQKITLFISKGPKMAKVRDLKGFTQVAAENTLKNDGFENIRIESVYSDKPENTVVEQSIAPDTLTPVNEEIVLQISMGPQPIEPTLVKVTHVFDLTEIQETQPYKLTIQLGEMVAYEQDNVQPGTTEIAVELEGIGVQYFDIYVNGSDKELRSEKVVFSAQ